MGKDLSRFRIFSGYTLKEIGQYLGLHYTTINKIIKRVENREKD
jgi:DNA-binding MarR family transcriptional regulator